MGEHIEDQPAAALLPVIPARPLRRGEFAVEHPPAEFEPDRQHPAEELRLIEPAQLFEAGQEQFVLDDAALLAGALGGAGQRQRVLQIPGDRLFEINVLAHGEGGAAALGPPAGGAGVEIDLDRRVGQAGVAIGAPFETAAAPGECGKLLRVAAEQERLWHEAVAIRERQPALPRYREQCPQMLGGAEPAGRAVDDDADRAGGHQVPQNFTTETRRSRRRPSTRIDKDRIPGESRDPFIGISFVDGWTPDFAGNAIFYCLFSVTLVSPW